MAWIGTIRWALLAFFALALPAAAAEPKRVLILDSFGRDVAPFSMAAAAFRTTLPREFDEPVDMYEVSLDLARFADAEAEVSSRTSLRSGLTNAEWI